jgi:tRNA 2-thiocytidine biosynthesis protein TtcA
MPIILSYRKYPVSLIRPLAYLEERQIIACAAQQDILNASCTCPYGVNSGRRDIRKRIAEFINGGGSDTGDEDSGAVKRRILAALSFGAKDLLEEK